MGKRANKIFLVFSFLIIFIFMFVVFGGRILATNGDEGNEPAAATDESTEGVELGAPIGGEDQPGDFANYVNRIYEFAVVAGTSLAILVIIFAGYKYMSSSGDPQSTAEAKELLVGAIVGLVLILLTRLILVSIDPRILEFPNRNPLLEVQRAGPGATATPSFSGEEADIVTKAIELCKNKKSNYSPEDWKNGPCLTADLDNTGYAVDIAHNPREMVDDTARNQCTGATKFVELDLNCNTIRIYP